MGGERGFARPSLDENETARLLQITMQIVLQRALFATRRPDDSLELLQQFRFRAGLGDDERDDCDFGLPILLCLRDKRVSIRESP